MIPLPVLPGIQRQIISTPRLRTRILAAGAGVPVIFLHGNLSSATWWEETLLALPPGFQGIALDQRGFGEADPQRWIDATHGLSDLADDVIALLDHLGIDQAHIVGHSMGGAVIWRLLLDYPDRLLSVLLVAPGSPFGFSGTRDIYGTPCYADFAGSGGGMVNAQFVRLLSRQDRSAAHYFSPRNLMHKLWKKPFQPQREEALLTAALSTHVGGKAYPGDMRLSANWTNLAPGRWGINNALSPKYALHHIEFEQLDPAVPILWVRGAEDHIVSDHSIADVGALGEAGMLPGYPGVDVYPPQPMIGQIRFVLDTYAPWHEALVLPGVGHVPYLEQPQVFNAILHKYLD